jgi:hypothetical protein
MKERPAHNKIKALLLVLLFLLVDDVFVCGQNGFE